MTTPSTVSTRPFFNVMEIARCRGGCSLPRHRAGAVVAGCSFAGCGATEVPEKASSIAELYMLLRGQHHGECDDVHHHAGDGQALARLPPFTHAIVPMSARTKSIAVSKAEIVDDGRNDVAKAMIPKTKPAIPSPDFDGCDAGAACTVLVSMSIPFP